MREQRDALAAQIGAERRLFEKAIDTELHALTVSAGSQKTKECG
jgi:hypothetical protein